MQTPRKPLHHHFVDYFFPHERNNYRPHLFSATSVAVLIIAVVFFEGAYLVQTKFVFFKTDFLASVLPGALVSLTNQDRATEGLASVAEDSLLSQAAQAAAEDMAAKGYFSHISPDGKTPWYWLDEVGYSYSYAGENLAVNFTDSENVQTAWMASPTHRANIVKPQYTHIGFGTANGMYEGRETTFVVEFFATPAAAKVAAAPVVTGTPVVETSVPTSAPIQVLGSQTNQPVAAVAPASPSWFARLLASPQHTLMAILTILFIIIATVFAIAVLVRVKAQHRSVIIGGTLLLAFIAFSMLLSLELTGSVQLPADSQTASVSAAFIR